MAEQQVALIVGGACGIGGSTSEAFAVSARRRVGAGRRRLADPSETW